MSDPRRWLDDPTELGELERRTLEAARSASPPTDVRNDVWASLSAKLPAAGEPGASSAGQADGPAGGELAAGSSGLGATAAGGAGTALAVVKTMAIGAGLGAAVTLAGGWLTERLEPPSEPGVVTAQSEGTPVSAPAPVAGTVPSDDAAERAAASAPPASAPAAFQTPGGARESHATALRAEPFPHSSEAASQPTASVAAFALSPEAARATSRAEADGRAESRLVAAARDALRANDVARALGLLEQARTQFPAGVLAQEREALSVEGLVRSGQHAAARLRGEYFLRAFPASPHAARVHAALERAR